jgi:Ca2+-dependent lipid-binding protein
MQLATAHRQHSPLPRGPSPKRRDNRATTPTSNEGSRFDVSQQPSPRRHTRTIQVSDDDEDEDLMVMHIDDDENDAETARAVISIEPTDEINAEFYADQQVRKPIYFLCIFFVCLSSFMVFITSFNSFSFNFIIYFTHYVYYVLYIPFIQFYFAQLFYYTYFCMIITQLTAHLFREHIVSTLPKCTQNMYT